jgi:hypothetical protein
LENEIKEDTKNEEIKKLKEENKKLSEMNKDFSIALGKQLEKRQELEKHLRHVLKRIKL